MSSYNFLTLFPVEPGAQKEPNFPNIKYAAFKVLAPNKYKAKERLKRLQQREEPKEDSYEYYELQYAIYCAKEEEEENEREQTRNDGTTVVSFGDLIQLQHIGSKKYVTVHSKPSLTESDSLLVNLGEETSEGSIFKILSKYNVRPVGDEVRFGDQLKLESIKKHGQYLHSSSGSYTIGTAGYNVLSDYLELNLSPTASALTLLLHYTPLQKHHEKALLAGNCVRLFHKEDECYIVAEGSFAESKPMIEDVHCRLRKLGSRKHAMPSTSSNTYWQIERDDPINGGDLYWGDSCRIKHFPTRLYLCVTKDFQVTLKARSFNKSDYNTLFSFHSLAAEGDEVLVESYASVKHVQTGRWLHIDKKQKYKKKDFKPDDDDDHGGLDTLQWDSAELYQLTARKERGDHDSFTLQEVNEDLLDKFNYVAGIVPVLSSYVHIQKDELNQKQLLRIKNTLVGLKSWLVTEDERDTKNRQKLLRNLRVLHLIVEILKSAGDDPQIQLNKNQIQVFQACYEVIKRYLQGDSRKNENYLAKFIEFFQTQMNKGLNAEEVVVEIVQDNFEIIIRMANEGMDDMIHEFCKTKAQPLTKSLSSEMSVDIIVEKTDTRYLDFLGSLCVCGGSTIPSIQNCLLEDLVLKRGEECFLRTKVVKINGEDKVVFSQTGSPDALVQNLTAKSNKSDYDLLDAQLNLFAKLCKKNNKLSIEALLYSPGNPKGYIDFEQAILCAKDYEMDPKLRSRYIDLILVMFVDVGKNWPFMDNLCYSFIYNELVPDVDDDIDDGDHFVTHQNDDPTVAFTKVENVHFKQLNEWISNAFDHDFVPENNHVQILDILGHLVRFGYYKDMRQIGPHQFSLEKVIKYYLREDSEKYEVALKEKALEVSELFFRFMFYLLLQHFIYDFKTIHESRQPTDIVSIDEHIAVLHTLKILLTNDKQSEVDSDTTSAVNDHLWDLFNEGSVNLASPMELLPYLLKYKKLVTASLHLLTRMYYIQDDLFSATQQSQILISSASIDDYHRVDVMVPELRLLLSEAADEINLERVIELLRELSSLCVLSLSAGVLECNTQNQIMLDNFGLVSQVLSCVLKMASCWEDTDTEAIEQLFRECFCLLRLLATDRKSVQKQLFNRIDDILQMVLPSSILPDFADLLTEIFTGGLELVLKVSESHIERIFAIIEEECCGEFRTQSRFIVTLHAMAKVEELDLPVSRNQDLIVKSFCRHQTYFCYDFLGKRKEVEEERMIILKAPEETAPDPQLLLLLSVTDLLATCADSNSLFIQTMCQKTFSIEELIDIISADIPPTRKKPFVHFLIHVYMNNEGEERSQESIELSHGKVMWTYLEHVATLLENVSKALGLVPSEEKGTIKQHLITESRRKNSLGYSPVSKLPPTIPIGIPEVTDDKGLLIPGLLDYVADGIVPLLHAFYSSFFKPKHKHEGDTDFEYVISAQILKSLMQLSDELVKNLSNKIHIALIEKTLNTLLKNDEIKLRAGIDEEKKTIVLQHSIESTDLSSKERRSTLQPGGVFDTIAIKNPVSDEMLEQYIQQKELNDLFNSFSYNYQVAYEGHNSAAEQIDSSVEKIAYSDEGEELPLGPQFQDLVRLLFSPRNLYYKVTDVPDILLKQLEFSNSRTKQLKKADQIKQDTLDIRCLQILRAYIHNKIKAHIDLEDKERDPTKFTQLMKQHVVPAQEYIQSYNNAIRRIIPFLSNPNESISREALALMKALLFSGNKEVQDGLAKNVTSIKEETLFISLKKRLDIARINYTEIRELEKQLASKQMMISKVTEESPPSDDEETPIPSIVQDPTEESPPSDDEEKPTPSMLQDPTSEPETGKDTVIQMEDLKEEEDASTDDSRPLVTTPTSSTDSENVKSKPQILDPRRDTIASHRCSGKEEAAILSKALANERRWTVLIVEVAGLMCDGQNRILQDYLREQHDNYEKVNFVAEIADLLLTYTNDMSHGEDLEQIHQILQALIEMCVGNFENQHDILKLVIEPINRILQLPRDYRHGCGISSAKKCSGCKHMLDLIRVTGSAIELLSVMLEETSPLARFIAKEIDSSLEVYWVQDMIEQFDTWQDLPLVKDEKMDDDCERGSFRAYHIIASLREYGASKVLNLGEWMFASPPLKKYKDHTRSVEIRYKQNDEAEETVLTKVQFAFDPKNALRKEITEQVKWNINRDTLEDKQRALVGVMPALKEDIKHQMWLKKKKVLKHILNLHEYLVYLLIFLTVLLNMFILFVYKVPSSATDNNKTFRPDNQWFEPFILYTLGPIHLILSIWIVSEYFLINWPHFKFPQFIYTYRGKIKRWIKKIIPREKNEPETEYQVTFIDVNIFGAQTIYMIIFLLCSILSLAFSGYFYPFCLLFIIYNNDLLMRVLKAVTKNGKSLIWVAILGLIVLFIYAVISFALIHNQFIITDDANLYCDTLAQCMYSVMRYGLIDNIGLLVPFSNDGYSSNRQPVRLIYDLSFFIIVTTIGLNIVFGIIIDTFGELREERNNIESDIRSKCFICDIASYEFERGAGGFKNHFKQDHNMWNYVYYSLYLDGIDTGNHNAIQKYVYELIKREETGFLPHEQARSLSDKHDSTEKSLNELQQKVESVLQHSKDKEHAKSVSTKKTEQQKFAEEVIKMLQSHAPTESASALEEESVEKS